MAKPDNMTGFGKVALALAATAGVALVAPSAGLALVSLDSAPSGLTAPDFTSFTPATVDPELAQRVAASVRAKGLDFSFTPAGNSTPSDQTITVAVRVDDQTARAISVRSAAKVAQAQQPGTRSSIAIAPTRYNLGVARGYQGFAKPKKTLATDLSVGLNSVQMPDLSEFKPSEGIAEQKPSRFKPRISLEQDGNVGRSPQTLEGLGEQSVDLGGAYRVTKNLDVTAGVRISQERDRIDPLTDNVQDSQAVYVGTQFRF